MRRKHEKKRRRDHTQPGAAVKRSVSSGQTTPSSFPLMLSSPKPRTRFPAVEASNDLDYTSWPCILSVSHSLVCPAARRLRFMVIFTHPPRNLSQCPEPTQNLTSALHDCLDFL